MTENPQDDVILVTGAGGRLGGLLRKAVARDGADGVVFQSRARGLAGVDVRWQPGDAPARLPRCDMLVALWGVTSGSDAALAENAALVAQSRAVALACGARRVLHLSSAGVYGPGRALAETAPLAATQPYGRAKIAMERAVAALPDDPGLRHCCLRLANVIGADSLAPALRGERPLTLDRFADGRGPMRSYISASDFLRVCKALGHVPPADLPPVLNICAPRPIAMEALARAAGCAITWDDAPSNAVQEVTLDASALHRLLPGLRLVADADSMIADWKELDARA